MKIITQPDYITVRNTKTGKIHAVVNGALVCIGSTDMLSYEIVQGADILTIPYLSRCEVCYKRINRRVNGDSKTREKKAKDAKKLAAWKAAL